MLDDILHAIGVGNEKDRQINELQAMDDCELSDLGIARDQIEAFVRAHAPEE